MITARAYDTHMDQLFERIKRLHAALDSAGIEYRVVGGLAVFFQVSLRRPGRGRSTEDVDIAIDRKELKRIAEAAGKFGFRTDMSLASTCWSMPRRLGLARL